MNSKTETAMPAHCANRFAKDENQELIGDSCQEEASAGNSVGGLQCFGRRHSQLTMNTVANLLQTINTIKAQFGFCLEINYV